MLNETLYINATRLLTYNGHTLALTQSTTDASFVSQLCTSYNTQVGTFAILLILLFIGKVILSRQTNKVKWYDSYCNILDMLCLMFAVFLLLISFWGYIQ